MSDQPAGERPGHLDIDAVSAFIDRDLHPDDVTAVERHLAECPPCRREVVEIHTTVLLLAALPQYAPRRSFVLTRDHARAARRSRAARAQPWAGHPAPPGYPAPAGERYAGALAGLHAAALVIGALLLLVASSDFLGIPPQPAAFLREESVPAAVNESAPPPAPALEAPQARVASAPTVVPMVTATAFDLDASYSAESAAPNGTAGDILTSEGVETTADEAPAAPRLATTTVAAAMVRAQPTAAAGPGQGTAEEPEESAGAVAEQAPPQTSGLSRLRLVEIALAFGLAWLVVTITGLRWVQRVR